MVTVRIMYIMSNITMIDLTSRFRLDGSGMKPMLDDTKQYVRQLLLRGVRTLRDAGISCVG